MKATAVSNGTTVKPALAEKTFEGLTREDLMRAYRTMVLSRKIDDLVKRARSGGLGTEDITGGTFTVNNPGSLGSVVSTPIINNPQAAIISAEAIVKRPIVMSDASGDAIAIRSIMNLEISFDHRVLDGGAALKFLNAVKERLEAYGPESGIG